MKQPKVPFSLFVGLSLSFLLVTQLLGCGSGGGGGGGSAEVAIASLEVQPATVEVGGLQHLRINLDEVNSNLAIKIRHPAALQYVEGSGLFSIGRDDVSTNPAVNVDASSSSSSSASSGDSSSTTDSSTSSSATSSSSSSSSTSSTATLTRADSSSSGSSSSEVAKRYLVFYLARDAFRDDNRGNLNLDLRGKSVVDEGVIELDVDLDDPSVDNDDEFSLSNPLFEAEEARGVRVKN